MKILLSFVLTLFAGYSFSQVTVSQGNGRQLDITTKKHEFYSFETSTADFFVITKLDGFTEVHKSIVISDKKGMISTIKDLEFNPGVSNNSFVINKMAVVSNTPYVFVEHHEKSASKNTLLVRSMDEKGNFTTMETAVGDFPFTKMGSPGDWYISGTPDKKHIAVVGQLPHEKEKPDQFVYFFLDENLKQLSTGKFSFIGDNKRVGVVNFLASNTGEFYFVSYEWEKTFKYPVLYKAGIGSTEPSITPIPFEDPNLKNAEFKSFLNTKGELILVGYLQNKKTLNSATGTWTYNFSNTPEIKIDLFKKPIDNLIIRDVLINDNTFYLIGEQFELKREPFTAEQIQRREENYTFLHGDINVTAFNESNAKKFEIPVARKWVSHSSNQDLMVAYGIINKKLALIYNDAYNKYVESGTSYQNVKLPVVTLITNDGLMEQPIPFNKEFDLPYNSYKLHPFFFNFSEDHVVLLSTDEKNIRAAVFK